MAPDNRKNIYYVPGTVKCDLQLSNIHHAVEYSIDRDLQIKIFHELYQSKEELFVKQYIQFCFSRLSF